MTPDEIRRFDAKVTRGGGCWLWKGAEVRPTAKRPNGGGYGMFRADGRTQLAHRLSYTRHVGVIPDGMTIDHTCHKADGTCPGGQACLHRRCVNPAHLEPVPQHVNNKRGLSVTAGNDEKTECPDGHPYDGANTYIDKSGRRHCRTCRRARTKAWYDRGGGAEWHRQYHQNVRKSGT
jgi:hypothetical protein